MFEEIYDKSFFRVNSSSLVLFEPHTAQLATEQYYHSEYESVHKVLALESNYENQENQS